MKLLGKIGSFSIEMLVDSRSTHKFLDQLIVATMKVKVVTDSIMEVRVANGRKNCYKDSC